MKTDPTSYVHKMGLGLAIVYWMLATLRSAILTSDATLVNLLLGVNGWDFTLRIITAAAILVVSRQTGLWLRNLPLREENAEEIVEKTGNTPTVEEFIATSSQALFLANYNGPIIWNNKMVEITGLTREQVVDGDTLESVVGPQGAGAVFNGIKTVITDKRSVQMELTLTHQPAQYSSALLVMLPFSHPKYGNLTIGWVADISDIVARETSR